MPFEYDKEAERYNLSLIQKQRSKGFWIVIHIYRRPNDEEDVTFNYFRAYPLQENYVDHPSWGGYRPYYLGIRLASCPPIEGDFDISLELATPDGGCIERKLDESTLRHARLINSLNCGVASKCTVNMPFCHYIPREHSVHMEVFDDLLLNLDNALWHCGRSKRWEQVLRYLGKHPDDGVTDIVDWEDEMFGVVQLCHI